MAVKFRDYYEVLGVPRTASADEIKRGFTGQDPQIQPYLDYYGLNGGGGRPGRGCPGPGSSAGPCAGRQDRAGALTP